MHTQAKDADIGRPVIRNLTSLRFFAALAVIIQHYDYKADVFPAALTGLGYEAVTFFFVLSGFILTYAHAGASAADGLNVSSRLFWAKRAGRILPAYYLALAIAFPLFLYKVVYGHIGIGEFVVGGALVATLLQAWVPFAALLWNGPGWSLSVETLFYATFPGLWKRTRAMSVWRFLAAAVGLVVVVALLREIPFGWLHPILEDENFLYYFPLLHVPQFVLGVAIGKVFIFGWEDCRKYSSVLVVASVAALLAIALFGAPYPGLRSNAVIAPLFGALILGLASQSGSGGFRPLSSQALFVLGEASYGMYILHYPLLQVYRLYLASPDAAQNPHLDFVIYLCLVVFLAVGAYFMIEAPARRWIVDRFGKRAPQEALTPSA